MSREEGDQVRQQKTGSITIGELSRTQGPGSLEMRKLRWDT